MTPPAPNRLPRPRLIAVLCALAGLVALAGALPSIASARTTTKLSPVLKLTALGASTSSVTVTWKLPTGRAAKAISAVVVRYARGTRPPASAGAGTLGARVRRSVTAVKVSGLRARTTYTFAVFSTDGHGHYGRAVSRVVTTLGAAGSGSPGSGAGMTPTVSTPTPPPASGAPAATTPAATTPTTAPPTATTPAATTQTDTTPATTATTPSTTTTAPVTTTPGTTMNWSTTDGPVPSGDSGPNSVQSVSCPTSTSCIVTGVQAFESGVAGAPFTDFAAPLATPISWTVTSPSGVSQATACVSSTCWGVGYSTLSTTTRTYFRPFAASLSSGGGETADTIHAYAPAAITASTDWDGQLDTDACDPSGTCYAVGGAAPDYTSQNGWASYAVVLGTPTVETIPRLSGAATNATITWSGLSCPASGYCVAVGLQSTYVTATATRTNVAVISTLSGGTWTTIAAPSPSDGSGDVINAVACLSASNCQAVGTYQVGSASSAVPQALALSWDGMNWTPTAVSENVANQNQLSQVACEASIGCLADGFLNGSIAAVALAGSQATVTALTPTPGWDLTNALIPSQLIPMGCSTSGTCTVATSATQDYYSQGINQYWTLKGGVWGLAAPSPGSGNVATPEAVACPAAVTCVVAGSYGPFDTEGTLPYIAVGSADPS